jgi:hypothetical protein
MSSILVYCGAAVGGFFVVMTYLKKRRLAAQAQQLRDRIVDFCTKNSVNMDATYTKKLQAMSVQQLEAELVAVQVRGPVFDGSGAVEAPNPSQAVEQATTYNPLPLQRPPELVSWTLT